MVFRFLLKTEGLPYEYLKLPEIKHEKRLPSVLSREEIWRMLSGAKLLKHRLLIGLLYGCGLRCMEVRNIELGHLDFDRKLLHVVQGKIKRPICTTIGTSDKRYKEVHSNITA